MSVGERIRRLRIEAGRTQRSVADAAGIAVAHLSRVEGGRVIPRLRTLSRVADALRIEVSAFFDDRTPLEPPDRCAASLSGRCILDERAGGRGRRRKGQECYGPAELEALHLCNLLLQTADRETAKTVAKVMQGLLALPARREDATRRRSR